MATSRGLLPARSMMLWKLALCSAHRVPSVSVSIATSNWIAGRRLALVADLAARPGAHRQFGRDARLHEPGPAGNGAGDYAAVQDHLHPVTRGYGPVR